MRNVCFMLMILRPLHFAQSYEILLIRIFLDRLITFLKIYFKKLLTTFVRLHVFLFIFDIFDFYDYFLQCLRRISFAISILSNSYTDYEYKFFHSYHLFLIIHNHLLFYNFIKNLKFFILLYIFLFNWFVLKSAFPLM